MHGELDCATAELLTAVLADQKEKVRRLLRLDLSDLEFLDCTGLTAILAAHHDLRARCGALVLCGVRPRARRLLKAARLERVLGVEEAE